MSEPTERCLNCGGERIYYDSLNDIDRCPDCYWFGQMNVEDENGGGYQALVTIVRAQTVIGTLAIPLDIDRPAAAAKMISLAILPHLETIKLREEDYNETPPNEP